VQPAVGDFAAACAEPLIRALGFGELTRTEAVGASGGGRAGVGRPAERLAAIDGGERLSQLELRQQPRDQESEGGDRHRGHEDGLEGVGVRMDDGVVGRGGQPAQRVGAHTDDGIGLTVNAVTPGLIETDMTAAVPAKVIDSLQTAIPMRRMGRPDEIARVVVFLAADASAYITGQVWGVNRGLDM
jgi:Enoyl-(Acyl carrier protein) reductase